MKKTDYVAHVRDAGKYGTPVYQRVYVDDENRKYVRQKKGYLCIDNLPCAARLVRNPRSDWR